MARCLVLLALALLGCGGGGHEGPVRPDGSLGDAVLDFAIVGGSTPLAPTMKGTGRAFGSVQITRSGVSGDILVQGVASLVTSSPDGLTQILRFDFESAGPLAVGTTAAFDGASHTVDYDESRYPLDDPTGIAGTQQGWGGSDEVAGGTVTVTALSGKTITLRLTGVTLTKTGGGSPITIDGTVTGTISTPS